MKKVSLAEQLNAFASGRIIDSEGDQNTCFNFYDWFCKDSALERKAFSKLAKVAAVYNFSKLAISGASLTMVTCRTCVNY